MSINNPIIAQIDPLIVCTGSYCVTRTVDMDGVVEGCTPIIIGFEIENPDDDPLTNMTVELYLVEDGFQVTDADGFVNTNTTIGIPGEPNDFDVWRRQVTVPGINNNGGKFFMAVTLMPVALPTPPRLDAAFRVFHASNDTDIEVAANLFNDIPTVIGQPNDEVSLEDLSGSGQALEDPRPILIQGTLNADVNYAFFTHQIWMAPGAKIMVTNNSHFQLLGATLTGCDATGNWIEVQSGSTFSSDEFALSGQNPNRSLIKDGNPAIKLLNGSTANVSKTDFDENVVGISTPSLAGSNSTQSVSLTVQNSSFSDGQAGISLRQVATTPLIENSTFQNMSYNGIFALKSNLTVRKCTFIDIQGEGIDVAGLGQTLTQTGNGSSTISFQNCGTGIKSNRMNVISSDNLMEDVGTGYDVRYSVNKFVVIRDNVIKATKSGIELYQNLPLGNLLGLGGGIINNNEIMVDGNSDSSAGILANENAVGDLGWSIAGNQITLENARTGIALNSGQYFSVRENGIRLENPLISDGIRMKNGFQNILLGNCVGGAGTGVGQNGIAVSGSPNCLLQCNSTDNTDFGIHVGGGSSNPLRLLGNVMDNHQNGYLVGDYSGSGGIGGITGNQGILNLFHHGNHWVGSYSGSGAVHLGINQEVQNSRILVNVTTGSTLRTTENVPNSTIDFFRTNIASSVTIFNCSTSPANCPTGLPDVTMEPDTIKETDIDIVRGDLEPGIYPTEQIWTMKQHLYRRLVYDTSLIELSNEIDSFYQAEQSTTVGAYDEIRESLKQLVTPSSSTKAQLEANNDDLYNDWEYLQDILDELETHPDSLALIDQRDSLLEEMSDLSASNVTFHVELQTNLEEQIRDVSESNEAVEGEEVYETNRKAVNAVKIEITTEAPDTLTAAQVAILEPIAWQCPLSGGDAVYEARALLNLPANFDDVELCDPTTQPLIIPKGIENAFELSPNPVRNVLNVKLKEKPTSTQLFVITNALGKAVLSKQVFEDEVRFTFDSSELSVGTYFLSLFNNNGKLIHSEFFIRI
jgi:hypothetical protein